MTRNTPAWLVLMISIVAASSSPAGDFPEVIDTETEIKPVMPADLAASGFRVPEGFRVGIFAAEPEVRNPIAMAWDSRGRLWIAENYTYAERSARFDLRHRDRVLIFEDADSDGKPERRTVFTDEVQMLTSVEVGLGGAWLFCPPQVLFVPDADGDDRPDGPAEVVLDGFTVPAENYHNFANGLRWGPDGWLYGRCGASAPGRIGRPGTPDEDRVPLMGGLWRFHPKTKRFEALVSGTTNPWGHDWNAVGEAFFINTVNGHLWHAVAGMHLVRPHTIDPNPRAYLAIDQHADHVHWDSSKGWADSRNPSPEHDRRGGGHAHSGVMIYAGDRWPDQDRGKLFTLNFHGRRANVERLERSGSGYVGRHDPDRFFAADPQFRGIDLGSGPDGNVFVLDWNDSGECHESTGVVRTSGRIFKFSYGDPKHAPIGDLAKLGVAALVDLHRHPNDWYVRMARRQLADRLARGDQLEGAAEGLKLILEGDPDPIRKLRSLWSLHVIGKTDVELLQPLLHHDHESIRAWAIRLLTDDSPLDTVMSRRPGPDAGPGPELLGEFARMAREDDSGLVRLILSSTLQRLPVADRPALAEPLLARSEDASDHNQPLMIWYGLIPVADADPSTLARLGSNCTLPTTRRLIARRLAEDLERNPGPIDDLLSRSASGDDPALRLDVLRGLAEGLLGWRKARKPASWTAFADRVGTSREPSDLEQLRDLNVLFGDGRALDGLKRLALDDKADLESRRSALRGLIEARPADLRSICEKLVRVRFLNATAAGGLTLFDDPEIGKTLAANYRSFHPSERSALIDALASRPAFARSLLDQVAGGAIPRGDISAFQARQIRSLGDPSLSKQLAETWGELRDSAADKRRAMERLKAQLTTETLEAANLGRGRTLFNKTCASCHKLYGHGGAIGPDLTGSGRDNLDYLLENMVDPSAVVNADFRMSVVSMGDGRVLNGLVRSRSDRTITLQSPTEAFVLERGEVERIDPSPLSIMPEGQLDALSRDEVRDLIAYLKHPTQVPLPEEKE
ncbi:PVC-type heme-binding CxxCH protein [Tundrisphaera lichenicola]|uniref:PVC-type heme-binding CxxCH protein n=1 Tax=Tundrisphaera lichenicola TaxID=2029860 RepID=UPI003EBFC35F